MNRSLLQRDRWVRFFSSLAASQSQSPSSFDAKLKGSTIAIDPSTIGGNFYIVQFQSKSSGLRNAIASGVVNFQNQVAVGPLEAGRPFVSRIGLQFGCRKRLGRNVSSDKGALGSGDIPRRLLRLDVLVRTDNKPQETTS